MSTAIVFNLAELLLVSDSGIDDLEAGGIFRSEGVAFTDVHEAMFRRLAGPDGDAADGIKAFALAPIGEAQLAAYIGPSFVGFSDARAEVLGTVRAGETLYSQLCVSHLHEFGIRRLVTIEALIHTQDGALTLCSEHTYLLTRAGF